MILQETVLGLEIQQAQVGARKAHQVVKECRLNLNAMLAIPVLGIQQPRSTPENAFLGQQLVMH